MYDNNGQAAFSPDGNRYVRFYGSFGLNVFGFDRCSGHFFNFLDIDAPPHFNGNGISGAAFSPNSRFLYITSAVNIYQYDLLASNVGESQTQVGEWDGPYIAAFFMCQLGPDGRIYVGTSGPYRYLHIIASPDLPGTACDFRLRGLTLASLSKWSLPNFTHYRLGPQDGSICDSLGIDNVPVANWRHDPNPSNPLDIAFHDLSYYEPQAWQWNFGDGSPGSTERHPEHLYVQNGDYQVCLSVVNNNGVDTLCRLLSVGITSGQTTVWQNRIQVFPNPFRESLRVISDQTSQSGLFYLYDALGRLVLSEPLFNGVTEINTRHLATGFYFWSIQKGSVVMKIGKGWKG